VLVDLEKIASPEMRTAGPKRNYPNWHNRRTPLGGIVLGGEFGGIGSNPEVISPNGVR
jgi:hypothetical protein